ncbi:MAG: CZB domain-containing protein [Terracidiphilus sp.]
MDLDNAIQKHAEWKFKFRNALLSGEQLDAAAISRDNNCEFGKWLHGEARSLYGNDNHHAKCLTAHAAFHVEAGKVAAAINAKKTQEAEKMMAPGTPYSEISKRVGIAIIELKNATHK